MITFSYTDPECGASKVADYIDSQLSLGKRVLWMISGGSNVTIAVKIMGILIARMSRLENLEVTLTDERFGAIGHADSIWQQLKIAGFRFDLVSHHPILGGGSLDSTSADFDRYLGEAVGRFQDIVGQFGIGSDGHIAGVLPNSDGVRSDRYAIGYDGGKFMRVTMTNRAIENIVKRAFAFAYGESKTSALNDLMNDISTDEQPAQILKSINSEVFCSLSTV